MQVVQCVTYIQLPRTVSLTKARSNAFAAIDKMYALAYNNRHSTGSFQSRLGEDDSTFTPNEQRLLILLSDIMTSRHDVCVVHCGDQTFLFGCYDEYAASVSFKHDNAHFIE